MAGYLLNSFWFAAAASAGVITNGLIMYLDPGNASSYPGTGTTWSDLSGNNHSGSLVNTPTYNSTTNGGIFTFNGIDEYVDLNAYAGMNTRSGSYQIWVKDIAPVDNLNHQIFSRTNTNAGTFNILKRTTGVWGGNLRTAATPATQLNIDSTTSASSTIWNNVTLTYDGIDLKLYVNGALQRTSGSAGVIDTASFTAINLARNTTNAAYFPGNLGVVLAYNRALTDAEVLQNYNTFASRYTGSIIRNIYEYPYTASRSTSATTTSIDIASLNGVSNGETKGLAVFYMGTTDINATNNDVRLNLVSGSTTVMGLNMEPQDTTDRFSMGGVYFDASEVNSRFSSSFSPETSSLTAGYAGYTLVGFQLTGSDSGSHSAAATAYRNTTYTTKTSVALPAGTYIIIGSAAVNPQDGGVVGRVRMFDGTNQYGEMFDVYEQDTSNWSPYWHVFRRTIAGTTTFSLQARSDGSNDIEVRQASVIALDTSQFANVYYAERTGSYSTTSTTYVNMMSASFTIANPSNKHLLLAAAMISGSTTTDSYACKIVNNTTATDYIPEHLREPNSTAELYPTVVCRIVTFSGATNEIAWQLDCETGGTTAHIKDMTMAILDLGTT